MGMHERLCEDSEKLLRRENAALKEALAQHADVVARLQRLRAESDALREDLDDARASLCAASLEHEARQAELRRQLDSESKARKEAELRLASETAAAATMREELEARRDENGVLAAELEECRKELKAKDQELRCQVIAVRLERDEEVARIRGRMEWLQTSGHDACREQSAALQQELARAHDEIARLRENGLAPRSPVQSSALTLTQRLHKTPGKDSARSSESPGQDRNTSSAQLKMWPGALPGGRLSDREGATHDNQRDLGGKTSEGEVQNVCASPAQRRPPPPGTPQATTPASACTRSSVSYKPVSDGTVDSTRGVPDSGDGVINDQELPLAAVDVPESPELGAAARGSFRVSDLLAKSAHRRGTVPLCGAGRGREDVLNEPGDPGLGTVRGGSNRAPGAVALESPPCSEAKPKKRRLCLEVDDMFFVDA
ncbi:hypothetical protein V5799_010749 [Amblyomma americanum]|uniref:Uncharacterized protein n=1 Tax=Amblyomma americanum TaxID=6943 RepID=A0AAQ4EIT4_AMBAM